MNKSKLFLSTLFMSLMLAVSLQGQTLAMNDPEVSNEKAPVVSGTSGKMEKVSFTYKVYGSIPEKKPAFEEEHFLGKELTAKWNTFLVNYTQKYEMSVGFSNSVVEIQKPAVYNAVNKVNKYLKKAVRKGDISQEEARKELSHILDCANVICTETQTEDFELAASKAEDPSEIIALFDSVDLQQL